MENMGLLMFLCLHQSCKERHRNKVLEMSEMMLKSVESNLSNCTSYSFSLDMVLEKG